MKKLMVLIPDRLSNLVEKGEVTARYYNPGNVFDEVHIVMLNDDIVDSQDIKKMVGTAKLFLYNIDAGLNLFIKSLAWRPFLLKGTVAKGIALAKKIKPDMIRCHGNHVNTFIAYKINQELNVPYVVSFHINPDEDTRGKTNGFKEFISAYASLAMENISLKNAVKLMPVYTPIIPYLERIGCEQEQIEVCYNVLNPTNIVQKMNYDLSNPIKLVSVGRQFKDKDCSKIIHAVAQLENVEYTLYGDGAFHEKLKELAKELDVLNKKVFFIQALTNDELCKLLPSYDIFITHTEYAEISKSVLESQLCGLPMILSKRHGFQVKELQGNHVLLVNDDIDEYREILTELINNNKKRKQLGENAKKNAWKLWDPKITEKRFSEIYLDILKDR